MTTMPSTKPRLTVAICTYNNADLLDGTITSIAGQHELAACCASVLIVDNNCTDHTADVVQQHVDASAIPSLHRICESVQGLASARRCALRHCTTPYIAFIDDDCLLNPDWLQAAARFLHHHPRCGALGGRVTPRWLTEPTDDLRRFARSYAAQDHGDAPLLLPAPGAQCLVGAGLVLSCRGVADSGWVDRPVLTGRSGTSLTSGDDSELVFRVRNAGYETWYTPAMQLEHVIPKHRMTIDYLCRLQRGFGRSTPWLDAMSRDIEPDLRWRLVAVQRGLRDYTRSLRDIVRHDLIAARPAAVERRVAMYRARGRVEGALQFLFSGGQAA